MSALLTRILYCKEIVMIYFNDQQALTAASIKKVNYWANYTVNYSCSFRVSKSTDSPCYRPPTNLREGNIFTGVCHLVRRGGYAWPQVPSRSGGVCLSQKSSRNGYASYIPQEGTHLQRYTPQRYTLWKVHTREGNPLEGTTNQC